MGAYEKEKIKGKWKIEKKDLRRWNFSGIFHNVKQMYIVCVYTYGEVCTASALKKETVGKFLSVVKNKFINTKKGDFVKESFQ